jgi:DNA polymerase V
LNDVLVLNPLSTFLFGVEGDSMEDHHIFAGDRVIVDRSVEPLDGRIVLACVDGEFTVKQLYRRDGAVLLLAGNPRYQAIQFREGQEMSIWGVVTWTLRSILHTGHGKS